VLRRTFRIGLGSNSALQSCHFTVAFKRVNVGNRRIVVTLDLYIVISRTCLRCVQISLLVSLITILIEEDIRRSLFLLALSYKEQYSFRMPCRVWKSDFRFRPPHAQSVITEHAFRADGYVFRPTSDATLHQRSTFKSLTLGVSFAGTPEANNFVISQTA